MGTENWKIPLILALVVAAGSSAVYWLEWGYLPKHDEQKELSEKPFSLKETSVKTIEITNKNGTVKIACEKGSEQKCRSGKTGSWEIQAPLMLSADNGNVNSLISSMNNLNQDEIIDIAKETPEKRDELLKGFGFSKTNDHYQGHQSVTVTLEDDSKSSVTLGEKHPFGGKIYALRGSTDGVEANKVYLFPTYFQGNLEKDLFHWRLKKLFKTLSSSRIKKFNYQTQNSKISGTRQDESWMIGSTKPKKRSEIPGDIENIDSLLNAAFNLKAKSIVAEDKNSKDGKSVLRSAQQLASIQVTTKDEKQIGLTVFKRGKKLLAFTSDRSSLFELEENTKDKLVKEFKDLQASKLITSVERYRIKKMFIEGGNLSSPAKLEQKDSKWTVVEDQNFPLSSAKVSGLLDKLTGNRIIDIAKATQPTGKTLTISLKTDKDELKRKYRFWKKGKKLFAKDIASKSSPIFEVDPDIDGHLPWELERLKLTKDEQSQPPVPDSHKH